MAESELQRFGPFELDVRSRELRTGTACIRLQEQPFEILRLMLERPGEVVTRDDLRQRLWPDGTFVDFEHSLNAAIKRLRAALGDEADNPKFVQTLPRRGYRFIGALDGAATEPAAGLPRVRLAVLPFSNLSEEAEYFTDGLTDEMISQLGQRCRGRIGYERHLTDCLSVQADVAARIAESLAVEQALASFTESLRLDPQFAPAHAGIARLHTARALHYRERPKGVLEVARVSAARAMELDPTLAEAHLALADIRRMLEWDWRGAEAEYLQAITLNPSQENSHRGYGAMLIVLGRPQEALREIERAVEMDPLCLVVSTSAAWVNYLAGDAAHALRPAISRGAGERRRGTAPRADPLRRAARQTPRAPPPGVGRVLSDPA